MAAEYRTVAKVGEIPEGTGRPFEVEGRVIAVFLDEGAYFATDDACPHQGAPLCDGMVFERSVTCAWHGWRFSIEDGRWLDSPKSKMNITVYSVRVEADEIQVLI